MKVAIDLAITGKEADGGGPFGCVIVQNGKVIAQCHNEVNGDNDCTQHAELRCIQLACATLQSKTLKGCDIYTSCVPCMMCLGAMKWAKFDQIYYGVSAADAKKAGFVYADMYYAYGDAQRDADFNMSQKMRDEAVAVWQ
ncbi:nucleoside deaminase [Dokdonia sinensis]|uniref:Nucleoside deaminase n=2 Tax=Dokdonia sinensis TaxID=2479847 RepID=A0A3M0G3L3_9FLAO|nr:nucleoside deaminase [Dokdonia sinensis]